MRPEDRLRARCAMLLRSHPPVNVWWTAIEHGRRHHGTPDQRAQEWQRLARQGVQTGISDLLFIAPGFVLMGELKVGAGKQTEAQEMMEATMKRLGHGYEVVRSVEQLGEALERNGIALAPGWRVKAQLHDLALDTAPKPKRPAKPRAPRATRAQIARGNAAALVGVRR